MTAANPAAASDAAKLPRRRKSRVPSERNRQVFVEVVVRGREQPEVARELGITQQRVSQIIEQFYSWLAENVPPQAAGMSAEEQLRLAANLAYLRLENAQAEAQRNYRESGQETQSVKIRYSAKGEELGRVIHYKTPRGTCSHLTAAIRASREKFAVARMALGILSRGIEVEQHLAEGAQDPRRQVTAIQAPALPAGVGSRLRPATVQSQSTRPKSAPDPVVPTPAKVLCGSPQMSAERASLASEKDAASGVSGTNCDPGSKRKFKRSPLRARFFKPCAKPLSGGNSEGSGRSPAVGREPALVEVAQGNHDLEGGAANCSSPVAGPPTRPRG